MKAPVPRPPPPAYGTKSPKALDTVTRCVATLREKKQDGRLVGAVTHVLVNDPTRGYGIFIENMLDAAG